MIPIHDTRALLWGLGLVPLLSATLSAQVPDTTLGDTLLVATRFASPFSDTISLPLYRNGQYRVAVLPGDAQLRVRPVTGKADAFVARARLGSNGRSSVFEVSPIVTAMHRVTVSQVTPQDTVSIWIWADRPREAGLRERREREWGVGLLVAAGYHSGYRTHSSDPSAKGSADFLAGVLIGSSRRLSLLVGVFQDSRYAGSHSVTGVLAEPRVQLVRTRLGGRALVLEAVGRIAQGNSATITVDPSYYGLGPLLTYHLDSRPGSRGWRLEAQVTQNWVRNIPVSGQGFSRVAMGISWLP